MCKRLLLLTSASVVLLANAREWEDPELNFVNREPARAVSFPLADAKAALTPEDPATPYRLSLNGNWTYWWSGSVDERPTDFHKPDFDTTRWSTIDVPSCVELRGFGIPIYTNIRFPHQRNPPLIGTEYNPVSSYRTTFSVPAGWQDRPVFVRFEGVYSAFHLWLNGEYIGYSEDSKLPAEFNLTKYLKSGKNLMAVEVYRWCDGSYLEDQDMFRFSGIYRDVSLFSPPPVELRDFWATTKLDKAYKNATLGLQLKARSLLGRPASAVVRSQLFDANNKLVATLPDATLSIANDGSDAVANLSLPVTAPRLWSAEDPYLYTLVMTLNADGKQDIRTCKVGFRQVEIQGGKLLYNGKPIKFKGVNRHETCPDNGRTVSREQMLQDVLLCKRYNINTIRTAHYPDHYYFYQLCDRYGIYLVAEANVESHGMGYGDESLSHPPVWKKAHVERNVNHVEVFKNHPSIYMWSLGNEAGPGPNFKAAADAVHQLDPTRPIHYERNSSFADVDSTMYPTVEWLFNRGKDTSKPFFLCEYAHAMGNAMGNFAEYWDAFYSSDSLTGGCVWDWIDQALWKYTDRTGPDGKTIRYYAYGGDFDDKPNDGNFVCNGIITPDRAVTPKLIEVSRVHQELVVLSDNAATGRAELWNRFGFTPASLYEGRWELTEDGAVIKSGTLPPLDVAPMSRKAISLPVPQIRPKAGAEYLYRVSFYLKQATLWAGKGHEIASSQLPFSADQSKAKPAPALGKIPKAQLRESSDTLTITGTRGFELVISRRTGTIASLKYNGRSVIADRDGITHGPQFNAFRAFVDNDIGIRNSYFDSGLTQMSYHPRQITAETLPNGQVRIAVEVDACGFKSARFNHLSEYLVAGDGTISVQNSITPAGKLPALPRMGIRMKLDGAFEKLAYYGRGPWENYVDRKAGSHIGYYESTVTDQYVPYVRLQECGNKCDVRWAAFTDNSGNGVLFSFPEPLFMTATHFTSEDLDMARHRNGQERLYNPPAPREEVCLALDITQRGLGGASCGPGPMTKYIPPLAPVSYTYIMRPCQAGQSKLATLARSPVATLHAPQLLRSDEAYIIINGTGILRYTVDGSEPTPNSTIYREPFLHFKGGTIKAAAFTADGSQSAVATLSLDQLKGAVKYPSARTRVVATSSHEPGEGNPAHAIDGDPATFWHTRYSEPAAKFPHSITIDAGASLPMAGIYYQGRSDGNDNGWIKEYRLYISSDGQSWGNPVLSGTMPSPQNREQRLLFERPQQARFIKLEALSETKGRAFTTIAELGALIDITSK